MKNLKFHWQILIALVFGLLYASIAVYANWQEFTADFIAPFGEIFIRLLKLIAVPLVLFSIIDGVISLKDIKALGSLGLKTLSLFVFTTICSVSIGLLLVNTIKPGEKVNDGIRLENRINYELWRKANPHVIALDDRCESCKIENQTLLESKTSASATLIDNKTISEKIEKAKQTKDAPFLQPLVDIFPSNIFQSLQAMDMLPIIFFALFFGYALLHLPHDQKEFVTHFITSFNAIFHKMIALVVEWMPFFVFALVAGTLVKTAGNDFLKLKEQLSFLLFYGAVVIIGLIITTFVLYPILILIITRKNKILTFYKGIADAQITAFSTSSSAATLPITLECVNQKLGVPKSISSFVLPIGATVNMDGTSLYQAVAVVALAQFHMIDLAFSQQLTILFMATLASIGAAAVPSAGLVLLIVVLESVGLNPAWIAIILPIDRILDMFRTVTNVTGDCAIAYSLANSPSAKT